jgi:hypothetical protein
MRRIAITAVCALALAFVACKPKAGASCKLELKEVCIGDKQALACHDGKWEEMSCKGPQGCAKAGSDYACDQTVAEDKDVCNVSDDHLCTADKKSMLECTKQRKWAFVQNCLGTKGCVLEAKKVTCDNSLANTGDDCTEEDDYACSVDGKTALVCRAKKFIVASNCKGKLGCKVSSDKNASKVECDDSIAAVGEPCEKEGHYACAPDEKSIVRCVSKKFVQDDKCKGREKCAVKGEQVGCY